MPPSQLKRLKASLREKGIVGPQKSKKQKKQQHRSGGDDVRAKRNATLAEIREDFNPFDVKTLARPKKFEVTTLKGSKSKDSKAVVGRPGVSKSFGEESRRQTLLPELNRRHKVGGITDRRFGENDPTMTPEERAMERFVREKQKKSSASLFNLEDAEDDEEAGLTHGGKALSFGDEDGERDDFDAGSLDLSSDGDEEGRKSRKRRFSMDGDGEYGSEDEEAQPERKKSKAEVMKEVIAKSKLHKYERQKGKEDDDEEREKLDEAVPDLLALLKGHKPPRQEKLIDDDDTAINSDRQLLIEAEKKNKEFDAFRNSVKNDKKAQPTNRTKTEEEIAIERAEKAKILEAQRLRRMAGEEDSEDEAENRAQHKSADDLEDEPALDDEDEDYDDAKAFGISRKKVSQRPEGVEDEDDFLLDDDLVADGSDLDSDQVESGSELDDSEAEEYNEEEENEFVRGLIPGNGPEDPETGANATALGTRAAKPSLRYTCPTTHEELLEVFENVATEDTHTVVQRIRALYHPQLSADNTPKLAGFSAALVEHISYLSNQKPAPPLSVMETLIRHLHSLSRQFAEVIGAAFRLQLNDMHQRIRTRTDTFPTPGDLTVLTAVGTIYPTSDHFHQVVTPAITIMASWLGLSAPTTTRDLDAGAYICTLILSYQKLSKRYVPELINFCVRALSPKKDSAKSALTPTLISTYTKILLSAADLWSQNPAFIEIFTPHARRALQAHKQKSALRHLDTLLAQSALARRPLELHHHRPIPIPSKIPKFEEGFNPAKHYDPNRERAEASKLKAEYKKERKGALRELRKDANFIARTKLQEKKEADKAYEAKYKRLIQSIQSEEGREANQYEREKRARKGRN